MISRRFRKHRHRGRALHCPKPNLVAFPFPRVLRPSNPILSRERSRTPRSDQTCRGSAHQCIDTVGAWTECHDDEHAAHHGEVSEEGRSVSARCRRVTYGPICMENQRKRKRVKEKCERSGGKSSPSSPSSVTQAEGTTQSDRERIPLARF